MPTTKNSYVRHFLITELVPYSNYKSDIFHVAVLNAADVHEGSVRAKPKHPHPSGKTHGTMSDAKAGKQAASRGRKMRRNSAIKS